MKRLRYTISKEIRFEAAHNLVGLPPEHKCSNLHGHSYVVKVWIRGYELDDVGFVVDYGTITKVVQQFDHCYLNERLEKIFGEKVNPTAENLCKGILTLLNQLFLQTDCQDDVEVVKVEVNETCTSSASVEVVDG